MTSLLKGLLFVGDLLLINSAVFISYLLLGQSPLVSEFGNSVYLLLYSSLAWFFLVLVSNPYEFARSYGIVWILKSQLSFIFVHLLIVASLIIFFKKTFIPEQILLMYGLFIPMLFFLRLLILFVGNFNNTYRRKNFIIIGRGNLTQYIRKALIRDKANYRFLATFDASSGVVTSQLVSFCRENTVHEIYCCVNEINNAEIKKIIDFGLNRLIKVKLIEDSISSKSIPVELLQYENVAKLDKGAVPLDDPTNRILKRSFDLLFSSLVITLILSWVLPILYLLIKLESKGPFLFKQERAGRNNKIFLCFKIRTMIVNNDSDTRQATKNDERITKTGKILRKTSLDEIPQFFNVFKGEMSVIGPRPHPLKLNTQFSTKIERLMSRHYVKPGITGLAQCLGYRGETKNVIDMENRIRMDRYYIENWSFGLDLRIVFLTILSLLRGSEKAY